MNTRYRDTKRFWDGVPFGKGYVKFRVNWQWWNKIKIYINGKNRNVWQFSKVYWRLPQIISVCNLQKKDFPKNWAVFKGKKRQKFFIYLCETTVKYDCRNRSNWQIDSNLINHYQTKIKKKSESKFDLWWAQNFT